MFPGLYNGIHTRSAGKGRATPQDLEFGDLTCKEVTSGGTEGRGLRRRAGNTAQLLVPAYPAAPSSRTGSLPNHCDSGLASRGPWCELCFPSCLGRSFLPGRCLALAPREGGLDSWMPVLFPERARGGRSGASGWEFSGTTLKHGSAAVERERVVAPEITSRSETLA